MRRILNLIRSNNLSMAYLVVEDDKTFTIEVWQCNPQNNQENVHCKTFGYAHRCTPSYQQAQRQAKTLATALSKMTAREALRQIDKLRPVEFMKEPNYPQY